MVNGKPQLLIIDETLMGYSGHAYFYDLSVAKGSAGIFDRAVIYHRMTSVPRNTAGVSFRQLHLPPGHQIIYFIYRALKSRLASASQKVVSSDEKTVRGKSGYQRFVTYWYMAGIILRLLLSQQPALLMFQYVTLANYRVIERIARFLDFIGNDKIRFAIVLRYAPEKFLGTKASHSGKPPERVVLYTDTEQLSSAYRKLFPGVLVGTLPIPLSDEILNMALPAYQSDNYRTGLNIGFMGATRHEKGLANLLATIHATAQMEWQGKPTACFMIQINAQFEAGLGDIIAELRQLGVESPATHCKVQIIDGPLNEIQYFDTLCELDLLILPYSSAKYQYSSSGLVPEALALGIPILCFADSWAGQQIRDAEEAGFCVGETVDATSEFAAKIMLMLEQYQHYSQSCAAFAHVVRKASNGTALARQLYDHSY